MLAKLHSMLRLQRWTFLKYAGHVQRDQSISCSLILAHLQAGIDFKIDTCKIQIGQCNITLLLKVQILFECCQSLWNLLGFVHQTCSPHAKIEDLHC